MHTGVRTPHPFDSLIEEELLRVYEKYAAEDATITNQAEISTPHGIFRLDFQVIVNGIKFGIEADGKEFHSYTKDMFRDSIILGYSDLHAIYRIKGKDIIFHIEDALYSLSVAEPRLFSSRGLTNLRQLSEISRGEDTVRILSETVFGLFPQYGKNIVDILYVSKSGRNPIWKRLSDFARLHPKESLEKLIELGDASGLRWYRD